MSSGAVRVRSLPGGPGQVSAAIDLPSGETRILQLKERQDLLFDTGLEPFLDGRSDDLTWAATGALPLAMNLGADIVVEGLLQKGVAACLGEYSKIWQAWRPDLYRQIGVHAEAAVDLADDRSGSAVAFSAGLDSLHTLFRVKAEYPGEPLVAVMLWGFDYQRRDSYFSEVASHASDVLEGIGVRLSLVETNWKEVASVAILMEFASGVTSALQAFAPRLKRGFLAADYHSEMAERMLPHGSNPITNPLLSTDQFPVTTIGYDATRTEKTEYVAREHAALEVLRVCNAFNCGVCEKCQRTRWALFAVGIDRPPTFGRSLPFPRPWLMLNQTHRSEHFDGYWAPLVERARGTGRRGLGLFLLRLQVGMLSDQVEGRGLWRLTRYRRLSRLLAEWEKRLRGALEKARWRLRGRRWKSLSRQD